MMRPHSKKPTGVGLLACWVQVIDDERKSRLEKIAVHKGVSMSGQVRMWIDGAYNKLPEVKR